MHKIGCIGALMISFLGTSITFAQASLVIPDENCFTISTDGEITEYDKNCPTALEIPTTIGGIEVQRIGPRAFKKREITEIKLPSTLKSIGKGAFAENQLNSIELPSGLERIENGSFDHNHITSIKLPEQLEFLGDGAFYNNKIEGSITIPKKITIIPYGAFSENRLNTVIFHDHITHIEERAFNNNQLTKLDLPPGLEHLGTGSFLNNKLEHVTLPTTINFLGNEAFRYNTRSPVQVYGSPSLRTLSGLAEAFLEYVDTMNHYYTPQAHPYTHPLSLPTIDPKNSIQNPDQLPPYTRFRRKTTPTRQPSIKNGADALNPQTGTIIITYPDQSEDEFEVTIDFKDDIKPELGKHNIYLFANQEISNHQVAADNVGLQTATQLGTRPQDLSLNNAGELSGTSPNSTTTLNIELTDTSNNTNTAELHIHIISPRTKPIQKSFGSELTLQELIDAVELLEGNTTNQTIPHDQIIKRELLDPTLPLPNNGKNQTVTLSLTNTFGQKTNVDVIVNFEDDPSPHFTYTLNYTKTPAIPDPMARGSNILETVTKSVPKANPIVNATDIEDKTPTGYKLDRANSTHFPHTISSDNENITVAYMIDTSDAGKVFDYEISYLEEGTTTEVHPKTTGKGYIGEIIPVTHTPKSGYVISPNQATTLTVLEQNTPTTMTILYKKDMDNDGTPDDTDEDIDGDGVSNAEENQHHSDPKDKDSKPNKYDHEPTVKGMTKEAGAPKLTEDNVKNAITNKDTFPLNTHITLDPSINLSTLQDTAGDKEVELTVTYPDGSKDTVKVKIKVEVANNNAGGNNNGNNNGNSSSSSGFSGGGGGGAALIRDHCPQGDFSRSYYDNSCGTAQDSDQTQDQNSDPQSPAIPTDNEMIDAYKRAFENEITTQPSLADARLLDYLTRAELAKMLSIFTLKYTDRQPILDKPFCDTYTDADQVNAELSSYMTTACKLEIMGLHSDGKTPLDAFMPNKHVSRAELVTVLSRVLYGNTYDNNTTDQRWQGHMDKLHTDAVIKDPTPTIQEIRAYVLLMMYRIKAK